MRRGRESGTVAANAGGGRPQAALWNVTRPQHPVRMAVLFVGVPGALWGDAFSPDGRILAVASATALALWNGADPARPRLLRTLVAAPLRLDNPSPLPFGVTQNDLVFSPDGQTLASVSGSGQVTAPASPCGCGADAAYAAGFTPDGRALTVVVVRPETDPSTVARDTVFTWQVAGSGALSDLTTIFRDVSDVQPVLAPGARVVADGSLTGGEVHLWTLPPAAPPQSGP